MRRRLYRTCLVPAYIGAIICFALWQNQLFYSKELRLKEKETGNAEILNAMQKITEIKLNLDPVEPTSLKILGEPEWQLPTQAAFEDSLNSTKYEGEPMEILVMGGGFSQAHLSGCPNWNCIITSDSSSINNSDAVVFYNGVAGNLGQRREDQYYVFFTQESPVHMSVHEPYPHFFNLSMGFRRDADLPCPYGYAVQRTQPLPKAQFDLTFSPEKLSKKRKKIAWFVSNCGPSSQRDKYVNSLREHISVDIFGACGNLQCPKSQTNECLNLLRKEYYFYLALENSICKDYTTEKFWEKGASIPIVPIVLKRALELEMSVDGNCRSLLEAYVPAKSFIAVDDFPSPQALAAYLDQLIRNPLLYAEYFKWRIDYEIIFLNGNTHDRHEQPWGFCRLCDLLWKKPRPKKIRSDFNRWWSQEAHCDSSLVDRILQGSYSKPVTKVS